MRQHLQNRLIEKHPETLGSCRSYGLQVGDGWFSVVDALCEALSASTNGERNGKVIIKRVETRFGRLFVAAENCGEFHQGAIDQAQRVAFRTCEICGKPGEWCTNGGYYRTACVEHARDPSFHSEPSVVRVFIDMDDVMTDCRGAFLRDLKAHPENRWPQSRVGFFSELKPLPDAIEAVLALAEIKRIDVHLLTAPSPRNSHSYTEKRVWVEKHLGYQFVKRLHISPRKDLFSGDILVDDNMQGKGQDRFGGSLIHFRSEAYPDWTAALAGVLTHPCTQGALIPIRERLFGVSIDCLTARDAILQQGLPFSRFSLIRCLLGLCEEELTGILGATSDDVSRWRADDVLPYATGKALYELATMLDWAFSIYKEDLCKAAKWLSTSLAPLGGRSPLEHWRKTGDIKMIRRIAESQNR